MDEKDREIIHLLQTRFPLEPEPYKAIGDKVWIDEVSVISRLARMFQEGSVRYIGPYFDGKKLGFSGCLAAADVEVTKIESVSDVINKFPEVSHNYLREGSPNLWFTVTASSEARRNEILEEIKRKTGISEIKVFKAKKAFKTCVNPIKEQKHE